MEQQRSEVPPRVPSYPSRKHLRLPEYDYSQCGAYFVTICTRNRMCLFGEVSDETMILNDAGKIVEQCWSEITDHFPDVTLDYHVIMPNHVHGIVIIGEATEIAEAKDVTPLQNTGLPYRKGHPRSHGTTGTLGAVIRGFKIGVTKWMRKNRISTEVWQRNYFERIIRDEQELQNIRYYIEINPLRWTLDRYHPDNSATP